MDGVNGNYRHSYGLAWSFSGSGGDGGPEFTGIRFNDCHPI